MSIDRRSFMRSLSGQAARSVGAALAFSDELRLQVVDRLREEPSAPEPDTASSEAPALPDLSAPAGISPSAAITLRSWANEPTTASRLTPLGTITALDQRALPGPAPATELRSVVEVVEAMRAGIIDGGLSLVQAGAQAVALAAMATNDAPATSTRAVVRGAARALAGARPDIPLIGPALERMLTEAMAADDEPLAHGLRRRADALSARVRSEHVELAAQGAGWLRERFGDRLTMLLTGEFGPAATGSIGTTSAILRAAADSGLSIEVWVPDGEPRGRSAAILADALHETSVVIHRLPDVRVERLLAEGHVDAVVLGSSWISADGRLAGEIGSVAVALLANRAGIPVVGVASRSMVTRHGVSHPPHRGRYLGVTGTGLDLVEAHSLGLIVTDAGVVVPSAVRSLDDTGAGLAAKH